MLTEEVSVTDVEVAVNTYSLFSVVEMAYIWLAPSHPTWLIQGFRQQAGIAQDQFGLHQREGELWRQYVPKVLRRVQRPFVQQRGGLIRGQPVQIPHFGARPHQTPPFGRIGHCRLDQAIIATRRAVFPHHGLLP